MYLFLTPKYTIYIKMLLKKEGGGHLALSISGMIEIIYFGKINSLYGKYKMGPVVQHKWLDCV